MRNFILLLSITTFYSYLNAQTPTIVSGYYLTNANDTVSAQIKLPKYIFSKKVMLIRFIDKVELFDGTNKRIVFRVNDIKGFGFIHNDNEYQFLSKDFGRESAFSASTHRFYQAIVLGQKSNLYHRLTTVDENERVLGIMYFLEKSDGTNTALYFFSHAKPEFIRNQLKQFYNDNQEVHPLIDTKFRSKVFEAWQDEVIEIVQAVNRL